jgi:very-short-patch-repair endonuclease
MKKGHTMPTDKPRFHAPPELWEKLKPLARQMRHEPTPAEDALWQRVRNRRVGGAKFRRQYAIERFIVDFVCLEQRLIIEVDGGIHEQQQEYDAIRQAFLEAQGFRVLRFSNGDVLQFPDAVAEAIGDALASGQADVSEIEVKDDL